MVLTTDSDASYVVAPDAKRRITSYYHYKHTPDGIVLQKLNSHTHIKYNIYNMSLYQLQNQNSVVCFMIAK